MSIYFSVQWLSLLTSAEAKICFLSAKEDADWYFLIRKPWKHSCGGAHFSGGGGRWICLFPPRNLIPLCINNPVSKVLLNLQNGESTGSAKSELWECLSVCVSVVVSSWGNEGSVKPPGPLFVQFPFYQGSGGYVITKSYLGSEKEDASSATRVPAPSL